MVGRSEKKLRVFLTGSFWCCFEDGSVIDVTGAKHRLLIAMLLMAPEYRYSRNWLRETLWSRVDKEQGADSLRQALAMLRRKFGDRFDDVFNISRTEIALNQDCVEAIFDPSRGALLEGVELADIPIRQWHRRVAEALEKNRKARTALQFGNLRPRISIVPFLARGNDKESWHLSDLVAQEVLRILSRNHGFDVISHFSSRRYVGANLDLTLLSNELRTDYLATGTITCNSSRYRLDIDFIEVKTGRIVWTDFSEDTLQNLLMYGSDVMADIAHRIGVGVLNASVELTKSHPLPNVESHALFMSALSHMHEHRLQTFSKSRHMLEHLRERHPNHATVHAWLGMWYLLRLSQGLGSGGKEDVKKAGIETSHALEIDPFCPVSLTIDGMVHSHSEDFFDIAFNRFENAVDKDPNNALAFLMHSRLCSFTGDGENAVRLAERARILSPRDPQEYFFEGLRATAYLTAGCLEDARSIVEKSISANPRHSSSLRGLVIICQLMGDEAGARDALQRLRENEPNLTVSSYLAAHPAGDRDMGKQWAKALSDAGLPD